MTIPWHENDDLFLELLRRGYDWQRYVGMFFKLQGLSVEVPMLTARQNLGDAPLFRDQFDLRIGGFPIEVKSRSHSFCSPDDFPFEDAFVDTVDNYDKKEPKPLAYVFVSMVTGGMIALPSEAPTGWKKERHRDNVRGIDDEFYLCDRALLRPVEKLVAYLKERTAP